MTAPPEQAPSALLPYSLALGKKPTPEGKKWQKKSAVTGDTQHKGGNHSYGRSGAPSDIVGAHSNYNQMDYYGGYGAADAYIGYNNVEYGEEWFEENEGIQEEEFYMSLGNKSKDRSRSRSRSRDKGRIKSSGGSELDRSERRNMRTERSPNRGSNEPRSTRHKEQRERRSPNPIRMKMSANKSICPNKPALPPQINTSTIRSTRASQPLLNELEREPEDHHPQNPQNPRRPRTLLEYVDKSRDYKGIAECESMCHPDEIKLRFKYNDFNIFETEPSTYRQGVPSKEYRPHIKAQWCLKKYVRAAADRTMNDPKYLRPPIMLACTMEYLTDNILDVDLVGIAQTPYAYNQKKDLLSEIYAFVCDRTRAIRQDFSIIGHKCHKHYIQIYEKVARFHLLASNQCVGMSSFDQKINSDQLTDTLASLRESYQLVRGLKEWLMISRKPINPENVYQSPNEDEFYAYSLLCYQDQPSTLEKFMSVMPKSIRSSSHIHAALQLISLFRGGNFVRYFRMLTKVPYLFSCAVINTMQEARKRALTIMAKV